MAEHSAYQQRAIRNFYRNRDAIAVQRLQELVTELYLSSGKKRQKCWDSIALHLAKLEVPQPQIDHLIKQDNPELIAKFVTQLLEK